MRKYHDPRNEIYDEQYQNPVDDAISAGLRNTLLWMIIFIVYATTVFVCSKMAYTYGFKNGQRYPTEVKASNVSYKWKKVKKAKKRNHRKAKHS